MAFCAECGTRLSEGARFCPQCGTAAPLRQAQAADPGDMAPGVGGAVQAVPFAADALADTRVLEAPDAAGEFVAGTWGNDGLPSAEVVVAQAAQDARRDAQQLQTHRPSVQYSSSRGIALEPQPKKKSKLPLVIVAVLALVAVAFCAVYIVPLFIPHPHDPHEDMALTSGATQAASSASSAASPSNEAASSASSAASPSSEAASSAASSASGGSTGSATASESQAPAGAEATSDTSSANGDSTSPRSFSPTERPELSEFTWLTGDTARGNVPAGATRLTQFADVEGGWKGYVYDGDVEWLMNARIDGVQGGVAVTIDWYYLRIGGASGEVREDDTPDSLFNGSWSGGALDATGPGRLTLAAFWQQGGHQYAAGSLVLPDGDVCTIVLVRP